MGSLISTYRELQSQLEGEERYIDIALAMRRRKTKETLLFAGGQWDTRERQFTDRDPAKTVTIYLEESQVEFTRWFASFLAEYRDGYARDVSLALVAGDRRGGKTFDTFFCQIAALIDVPLYSDGTPTNGWIVSRTYKERDELDQLIVSRLPDDFYKASRGHDFRYTFPHGSYLRSLSADDPKTMKQGRVDFLLYNEPQKMSPKAIKHGLFGTADRGGLTMLAANPPDGPEGEWLYNLKEGIEEDPEIGLISRFFNFSSKDNQQIDQPARRRVAKLAQKISPEMSEADAEGTWRRWGDLAYPGWNGRTVDKGGLVGSVPTLGATDITAQVTRQLFYTSFPFVIGGDFQRRPQAAAVLKIFDVPGVGHVYWFIDEVGVKGTEIELSTELMGFPHSYSPTKGHERSAVWIGDCSGSYQGAQRIPGRTSFGLLESEGWTVYPAEIIKGANSERPKNPDVGQRLGLMYRLMEAKRIRVVPECTWLINAFSKCQLRTTETGTRVPKGAFSHISDAASYAIWRCDPKPGGIKPPPPKHAMRPVTLPTKGPRIL